MIRAIGLALLGMLLLAGNNPALAQLFKLTTGDQKPAPGSRDNPLPVGPWYAYWPLESHFQVPGVPAFPYYSSPMTLPVTPPSPYGLGAGGHPGMPGGGMHQPAMGPYGGNPFMGGMPYGGMGQPGFSPYGGMPYPGAAPAAGGYPGGMPMAPQIPTAYPGMPFPGMTSSPAASPSSPTGQ